MFNCGYDENISGYQFNSCLPAQRGAAQYGVPDIEVDLEKIADQVKCPIHVLNVKKIYKGFCSHLFHGES